MDRRAAGALLALAACFACSAAAPTASNQTALDLYEGAPEGCYYNFQHYGEGDRIMTNEPCLNCTCHNRMLMCYLRVCPFTKAIGQDCTVEKRADQCCPIVTCPDVPVDLLTSTSTTSPAEYGATGLGKLDKYGCSISGKYFPEGSKVPPTPNKPCEHCYCIRNMTTCVMQECTLHVDGCTPIYHKDVCCPVRYSCDHPEDELPLLDDMSTTVRPTPGFLLTTTTISPVTQMTQDCVHDDRVFSDGALIKTEKACEHCYCMKGDIVCVVQECGAPMENEGKNCTSLPPREGQCCPDTYICEGDEVTSDLPTESTTESIMEKLTTLSPPRRTSVEGSGYRNEPDEAPYTDMPFIEPEVEGSGDEEETSKPLGPDEIIPTPGDDDQYIYVTTKGPASAEYEKTTVAFDKNIIPDMKDKTVVPHISTNAPISDEEKKLTTSQQEEILEPHKHMPTTKAPEIYESATTELGDSQNTVPDVIPDEEIAKPHEYAPGTTNAPSSESKDDKQTSAQKEQDVTMSATSKPEYSATSSSTLDEIEKDIAITTDASNVTPEVITEKEYFDSDITRTTSATSVEGSPAEHEKQTSQPALLAPSTTISPVEGEKESSKPEEFAPSTTSSPAEEEKESSKPEQLSPITTSSPLEEEEKLTTEPDHAQNTVAVSEEDHTHPHSHIPTTMVSPTVEEESTTVFKQDQDVVTDKVIKEDIPAPTEHVTTAAPADQETEFTTAEPDRGLNTIPSEIYEETSSEPSLPGRTTPSEETKGTEPSVITDEMQTQGIDVKSTTVSELTTPLPESIVTKGDQFTVTTEPSFRKEDEGIVSTEKPKEIEPTTVKSEFVDEGLIPTSPQEDKIGTSSDVPITEEEFTTSVPEYVTEIAETMGAKQTTTEENKESSLVTEKVSEPSSEQDGDIPPTTEKLTEITPLVETHEEPSRIPGEGDCLLNGVTYKNNTVVPSTNNCHTGCRCASSIIKCDPIICSPPPDYMDNCQSIYDSPDSCCPTFVCDHPRETAPPQSDNQMSGTESPMPSPTIECRGDQCELIEPTKQPVGPSEPCTSGNCLSAGDHKTEAECGSDGCGDRPQKPDTPLPSVEHTEECSDGKCKPESCANGECQLPQTQVSPVTPCEGEHCEKTEEIPKLPQKCKNGEDCKTMEIPTVETAPCEGESCNTIDCGDGGCGSDVTASPPDHQLESCKEEDGCKPQDIPIPECTGDEPCRRKETLDSDAKPPATCEGSNCVSDMETTVAQDIIDLSTELPKTDEKIPVKDTHETDTYTTEGQTAEAVTIADIHKEKPVTEEEATRKTTTDVEKETEKPDTMDTDDKETPISEQEMPQKPTLIETEGTETPDVIEEETTKPAMLDEKGEEKPTVDEEKDTEKPIIVEDKGTEEPTLVGDEGKEKPAVIEKEGTELPTIDSEEGAEKPAITDKEESTNEPVTIDEEDKLKPDIDVETTQEPAIIDKDDKEIPVIEVETTEAPTIVDEDDNEKPVIDEESTKQPDIADEDDKDKAVVDEESTKKPDIVGEHDNEKPVIDEESTKQPDIADEDDKDKAVVDEESTKKPDLVDEDDKEKPVIDEESTNKPDIVGEHDIEKPVVDHDSTKQPDIFDEDDKQKPVVAEESTKKSDVVEVEGTTESTIKEEEATTISGIGEKATDAPAIIDQASTPGLDTEKPTLIDEVGKDKPVDIEKDTTDKPKDDTEKPSIVDEEEKPTDIDVKDTDKPGQEPTEEMESEKPDLTEREGTERPTDIEEKVTELPALVTEDGEKKPAMTDDDGSEKPAITDEEGKEKPIAEDDGKTPAVFEQEDTEKPTALDKESTEKPEVKQDGTTKPARVEQESTEKTVTSDDSEPEKTPEIEDEHKDKPDDSEPEKTPEIEDEYKDKPDVSEESSVAPDLVDEDKTTDKPDIVDRSEEPAIVDKDMKKPALVDEDDKEKPTVTIKPTDIEREGTELPVYIGEENTKKPDPALVDEDDKEKPTVTIKPTDIEREGTELPVYIGEENTKKPDIIDEIDIRKPDTEADTIKPIITEEESTAIPDITEEQATAKPIIIDEGTEEPTTIDKEEPMKPTMIEREGTELPAVDGEKGTEKPAVIDEETKEKPDLVDQEGTKIPTIVEEGTEKPGVPEDGTEETSMFEPEGTEKPTLIDEVGKDKPVDIEKDTTDKPEHVTEKPSTVDEEDKPTDSDVKDTDKPGQKPTEEMGSEKPDLTEREGTERPTDIEEKGTELPGLVTEDDNKKPAITDEESTDKPAVIDEETKDKPHLVDQEGTKKPTIVEEGTEKPGVPEDGTEEPSMFEPDGTEKPTLIDEDGKLKPADEDDSQKPILGEDKDQEKPVVNKDGEKPLIIDEEFTDKPAVSEVVSTEEPKTHEQEGSGTETPEISHTTEPKKEAISPEISVQPIDEEFTDKPAVNEVVSTEEPKTHEKEGLGTETPEISHTTVPKKEVISPEIFVQPTEVTITEIEKTTKTPYSESQTAVAEDVAHAYTTESNAAEPMDVSKSPQETPAIKVTEAEDSYSKEPVIDDHSRTPDIPTEQEMSTKTSVPDHEKVTISEQDVEGTTFKIDTTSVKEEGSTVGQDLISEEPGLVTKIPELNITSDSAEKTTETGLTTEQEVSTDISEIESPTTKAPATGPVIIEPQDGIEPDRPEMHVTSKSDEESTTEVYGEDKTKPVPQSHGTEASSTLPESDGVTDIPEITDEQKPKPELPEPHSTESDEKTTQGPHVDIKTDKIHIAEKEETITEAPEYYVTEPVRRFTEIEDPSVTGQEDIATGYPEETTEHRVPSGTEKIDESGDVGITSSEKPLPIDMESELPEKSTESDKPVTKMPEQDYQTPEVEKEKPTDESPATEIPISVVTESQAISDVPEKDVTSYEEKATTVPDLLDDKYKSTTLPDGYTQQQEPGMEITQHHITTTEDVYKATGPNVKETSTESQKVSTDLPIEDVHTEISGIQISSEAPQSLVTEQKERLGEQTTVSSIPKEESSYKPDLPTTQSEDSSKAPEKHGQEEIQTEAPVHVTEPVEISTKETEQEDKITHISEDVVTEKQDTATTLRVPPAVTQENEQHEVMKSTEHTSDQTEVSETTPYLIELEEHTHKIVEDLTTISPSEEEHTYKPVADTSTSPSGEEHSQKPLEDIATPSPSEEEHSQKPVEDISTQSPSDEEHSYKPIDDISTSSPTEDEDLHKPLEDHSTSSPSEEEHSHKPVEDISTPSPSAEEYIPKIEEHISTVSPSDEKPTTVQPEAGEEPQVSELTTKKTDEEIGTATTEAEGTAKPSEESLPEDVSEKVSESTSVEETTPAVIHGDYDKDHKEYTTAAPTQISEESTPVAVTESEKLPTSESDIAVQTEKEVSSSEKPSHPIVSHETTGPEEEFIFSTTKATTIRQGEDIETPVSDDKLTKPAEKPSETSEVPPSSTTTEVSKPSIPDLQPTDEIPVPDDDGHFPTSGTSGYGEPDYVEEDQAFGPGTCRYGGKVYVSAQQIPRDDPCDFCFCFRSDIICLQQSCPPPIHGCHEEPIQGFCCPRYECPVSMATTVNVTTTTTTTTTTLPPHFPTHSYKGQAQRRGCQIKGHTYKVGEVVRSSSGPCLHCTCGGDGQMKCDPKACTPEPMLRQMIAAAVSAKRRR